MIGKNVENSAHILGVYPKDNVGAQYKTKVMEFLFFIFSLILTNTILATHARLKKCIVMLPPFVICM